MMLKKVFVAAILGISVFGLVLGDTALGVVDCYEYTGNQTVCGAAAGVFPCSGQVGGPVGAPCGIFIQYFGTISFPETIANGGGYVLEYTVGHLCAKVGDCKYTRNALPGMLIFLQ